MRTLFFTPGRKNSTGVLHLHQDSWLYPRMLTKILFRPGELDGDAVVKSYRKLSTIVLPILSPGAPGLITPEKTELTGYFRSQGVDACRHIINQPRAWFCGLCSCAYGSQFGIFITCLRGRVALSRRRGGCQFVCQPWQVNNILLPLAVWLVFNDLRFASGIWWG